jgi:tetratricopeptide (TPR) repeat protein
MVVAVIVTRLAAATTNLPVQPSPVSLAATNSADPVEKLYQELLANDDAAQAEVDKWIRDNHAFAAEGAGTPSEVLNRRIIERFAPVRQGYDNFIRQHTNHVRARIAYAGFLDDIRDEDGAITQLEAARALDPNEPSVWNNLANHYGHIGILARAFDYYTRAIELDPNEPVYYQNFGTTVYLFRKDAAEHYQINEQQVFNKALALYDRALKLAPDDFPLATDVAQTYYGIRPPRTADALRAWTNAFNLAGDEIEREGVHTHFARVKLHAGSFDEARQHLDAVTNAMYADLKRRLARSLRSEEARARALLGPPDGLKILSRQEWGAKPPNGAMKPHQPGRITIHHTATPQKPARTLADKLAALQTFSQNEGKLGNGKPKPAWPDVPYHYYIDCQGGIAEGRDVNSVGDTNTDYDPTGHLLIVLEGNFEEEKVTAPQWATLVKAVSWLAARHRVSPDEVQGHKDFADTLCPGKALHEQLGQLREATTHDSPAVPKP